MNITGVRKLIGLIVIASFCTVTKTTVVDLKLDVWHLTIKKILQSGAIHEACMNLKILERVEHTRTRIKKVIICYYSLLRIIPACLYV